MVRSLGTCRLCLVSGSPLANSHFVPRFAYKRMRTVTATNQNPVQITRFDVKQTSRQQAAYVLCRDCERLLSGGGEEYVSRICWQAHGKFQLRKDLHRTKPIDFRGTFRIYQSSAIPDLDVAKLTYFGASILWRASIWSSLNPNLHKARLEAALEERLRLFLKGQSGFPEDVTVYLTVVDEPKTRVDPEYGKLVVFPYKFPNEEAYWFALCGLAYLFKVKADSRVAPSTFFPGGQICLAEARDIGVYIDAQRTISRIRRVR